MCKPRIVNNVSSDVSIVSNTSVVDYISIVRNVSTVSKVSMVCRRKKKNVNTIKKNNNNSSSSWVGIAESGFIGRDNSADWVLTPFSLRAVILDWCCFLAKLCCCDCFRSSSQSMCSSCWHLKLSGCSLCSDFFNTTTASVGVSDCWQESSNVSSSVVSAAASSTRGLEGEIACIAIFSASFNVPSLMTSSSLSGPPSSFSLDILFTARFLSSPNNAFHGVLSQPGCCLLFRMWKDLKVIGA